MTITLGIDTSAFVAVGIAVDGEARARVVVQDTRAHAEALMPAVLQACAEAGVALQDVDEFVVGMGPGPFTGLRVGIATAWTLAHAAGRTPHGVCSLDVVARQFAAEGASEEFVVAADARREELYWRRYLADGSPAGDPQVSAPDQVPGLEIVGSVPDALLAGLAAPSSPSARFTERPLDPGVLAASWRSLEPAGDEPYYLRAADATVPGKPKSALPRLRAAR
ncbi:MAG: tRNA (adenosine(37)-N6)-threonylcarbamoyltransferase complex dimerization subunit type 1 TsaB [Arachnia sp.]